MMLNPGQRRVHGGGGVLHAMQMSRAVNVDLEVLLDEKNQRATKANPHGRATTMLREPDDVVNRRHGKHRRNSKGFQPGKRPSAVWTSVLREKIMPSEGDVAAVVVAAGAAETGAAAVAVEVAVEAGVRGKVAQETAVVVVVVGHEKVVVAGDREKVVVSRSAIETREPRP